MIVNFYNFTQIYHDFEFVKDEILYYFIYNNNIMSIILLTLPSFRSPDIIDNVPSHLKPESRIRNHGPRRYPWSSIVALYIILSRNQTPSDGIREVPLMYILFDFNEYKQLVSNFYLRVFIQVYISKIQTNLQITGK